MGEIAASLYWPLAAHAATGPNASTLYYFPINRAGYSPVGETLGQDEACTVRYSLVTSRALQERYCKPYINLPATGMRAIRISPDSASVM